jgi:phage tail tape-measure protein
MGEHTLAGDSLIDSLRHSITEEVTMNRKLAFHLAGAASLALMLSASYAADTDTKASAPMTGKEKATVIGAGTGAVAGAVVGGPVGAVVGAGVGGYVGHEGTDVNGKVTTKSDHRAKLAMAPADGNVRSAQAALNDQGYSAGTVDGQWGPATQNAVRRFQQDKGLTQTGMLDDATLNALGVSH